MRKKSHSEKKRHSMGITISSENTCNRLWAKIYKDTLNFKNKEKLVKKKNQTKPGVVTHILTFSTEEAEASKISVNSGPAGLHSEI